MFDVVSVTVPRRITFKDFVRTFNSITCVVMNGGHELYTIRHEGGDLFERCLLCQHETKGIKLDHARKNVP
jgi:hypothetical protein